MKINKRISTIFAIQFLFLVSYGQNSANNMGYRPNRINDSANSAWYSLYSGDENVKYLEKNANELIIIRFRGAIDRPIPTIYFCKDTFFPNKINKKFNESNAHNCIVIVNDKTYNTINKYISGYYVRKHPDTVYESIWKQQAFQIVIYNKHIIKEQYYVKHTPNCVEFIEELTSTLQKIHYDKKFILRLANLSSYIGSRYQMNG